MNTKHKAISALLAAILPLCFAAAVPFNPADKGDDYLLITDEPNRQPKEFAPPERRIERIMSWLEENNPEKAKELKQLRTENPEKFRTEIGKIARERFRESWSKRREKMAGLGFEPGPNMPFAGPLGPNEPPREHMREAFRERMQERESEILEWLKKNYPEEAQKLAELKEKDPNLYGRQMATSFRKYGRIMELISEYPELADVFKKDMELRRQQHELLEKIKVATNDDEKKKLTAELEQVIGDRFDIIVKRKQAEYEQLLKRLENLKQEVNRSNAEIEGWKQTKNEKVKERLNELMSKTDRFEWDR